MIQEKDFLYRVPVKTAPITTPRGQIRNPEILVDLEGGEFMHGNILDANSTNKLINQSVKDAVDNKLNESGYVTKDLLDAETSARTKGDEALGAKIKSEQTRAEGKEKEISDKLAIVDGDSNTEGSFRKAIADVIAAAPEDLDTLKEIADKLAGNDDLHTALNQAITEKADASALANEVTRATGAESGLQAAIATKADATALSNYVLTTALNQQVGTLNAAISAKQDAGNYIPYDSTDVSNYKVDRTIKVSSEIGYTTLDFGHIGLSDNNGSDLSLTTGNIIYSGQNGEGFTINPHQITVNNGYNKIELHGNELRATVTASEGVRDLFKMTSQGIAIQQTEGHDYVIKINGDGIKFQGKTGSDIPTGNGSFINIDNYAKKTELPTVPTKISQLTNDSDFITVDNVDQFVNDYDLVTNQYADTRYALANSLDAVSKKVDGLHESLLTKQDKGNYVVFSSQDEYTYNFDKKFILTDQSFVASDGEGREATVSEYGLFINDGENQVTYTYAGIMDKSHPKCVPTTDKSFKPISDFVLKEDVNIEYVRPEDFENLEQAFSGLSRKVSSKQDTITANIVDVTNLETADITQLRAIVEDLLNALSSSGLIIASSSVE